MPRRKNKSLSAEALRAAILPLVGDPRFQDYMQVIEDLKEKALDDATTFDSVNSARATVAALGTVRAYKEIIAIHESLELQQAESSQRMEAGE